MDTIQAIKQRFEIIGNEPKLNRAIEKTIQVAPLTFQCWLWVSGVGKKVFKNHTFLSHRKHGKYIAVNCGAIPEGTIDSELLGMKRRF
jgi:transcriptional regulator with PAS, ATPase and Fis domain